MYARKQGRTVLPQAVTYAAVLDRLNWAISRDWRVLEAVNAVWTAGPGLSGIANDLQSLILNRLFLKDFWQKRASRISGDVLKPESRGSNHNNDSESKLYL